MLRDCFCVCMEPLSGLCVVDVDVDSRLLKKKERGNDESSSYVSDVTFIAKLNKFELL